MARLARDERVHGHFHEAALQDVVQPHGVLAVGVELLRHEHVLLDERRELYHKQTEMLSHSMQGCKLVADLCDG